MVRGKRNKVKDGSVIVAKRPPYGYRLVKDGSKFLLEIDENEARIVRLIFKWYVKGDGQPMTLYGIREKLNEMGIPTPSDNPARGKTNNKRIPGRWIRGVVGLILKNETYAGTWRYGKRNGKHQLNSEDHQIRVQVPAIISRELWEAAQMRLAQNIGGGNVKNTYLLRRRVTCGNCNHKMHGLSTGAKRGKVLYYTHTGEWCKDGAYTCENFYFRADKVDTAVWNWVKGFFDPDSKFLEAGIKRYQDHHENELTPIRERLVLVSEMLDKEERKLKRWKEMYAEELISKEELTEGKVHSEEKIASLRRERNGYLAVLKTAEKKDEETKGIVDAITELKQEVQEGLD